MPAAIRASAAFGPTPSILVKSSGDVAFFSVFGAAAFSVFSYEVFAEL